MAVSEEMVERALAAYWENPKYKGDFTTWADEARAGMHKALTAALSDQVVAEPYLVWSNQHRAWWRANSCGYTSDIRQAGHYSRDEAISISGQSRDGWGDPTGAPDELAIPLSALPKNIRAAIPVPASTPVRSS